eukprot:SAG31_NODE_4899_length_2878_cov_1.365599_3_plen_78_part_00
MTAVIQQALAILLPGADQSRNGKALVAQAQHAANERSDTSELSSEVAAARRQAADTRRQMEESERFWRERSEEAEQR